MAIMMVPMIMVHTICDELKYGASRRLAPSSTAITDIPAKNSVRYKNTRLRSIGLRSAKRLTSVFFSSLTVSSTFVIISLSVGPYHFERFRSIHPQASFISVAT